MRGWSSIFAGFLLLGLAYWTYSMDGFGLMTMICGSASAMFFVRGAFGLEIGGADGATGLMEFMHNPADAIVDSATDKLADWLQDDQPQSTAAVAPDAGTAAAPPVVAPIVVPPRKVVAEGAMERYFAQQEAELAASASPEPVRGFGRKGL